MTNGGINWRSLFILLGTTFGILVAVGMVASAQGPTITISSPTAGALFKAGDSFTLEADVSDTDGIQTGSIEADLSQVTGNGGDTAVAPDSVTGSSTDKTATWNVTVGSVSSGNKTMTVRAEDTLNNSNSDSRTVEVDNTPPEVNSINRLDSTPTNASSVDFSVSFSESVSGVNASDFVVTTVSGDATGSVSSVSGSGSSYTVTVGSITGDGDLRLDVGDDDSITDDAGNPLGGSGTGNGDFASGQTYTIDNTAPIVDITRNSPTSPTNDSSVTFSLTFSESVNNIDSSDFTLNTTNTATGTIGSPSASSGSSVTLTVTGVSGDGDLGLDVSGSTDIQDDAGNTLNTTPATDEVFVIDNTSPSVSFTSADPTGDDFVSASEETSVGLGGSSNDANGVSSVTLEITDTGSGTATPSVTGTTSWSATADVSSLAEGQITYTATATDNAGNTANASITDTHDSVAPSVSVGANPTGDDYVNATEDDSYTVSGTSSDATSGVASVTLEVSDGTNTVNPSVSGTASWDATGVNVSSLNEGAITYTATATDDAGNTNTGTETDTHDSVAPSVSVDANPTGDDFVNASEDDSVTVTGTASDATSGLDTVTVTTTGGGSVGPTATDNAANWTTTSGIDVSSLQEGTITYTATATDTAGNSNTASETDTHDSVGPSVSIDADPTGDNFVNAAEDGAVNVTGSVSDATSGVSSVTVSAGAAGPNAANVSGGTFNLSGSELNVSGEPEGSLTYTATATDNAGNSSTVNEADTHDSVAPSVSVGTNPTGDDFVNDAEDNSFTVSGSSSDTTSGVASVTLEVGDGSNTVNPSVTGTMSWSTANVDVSGLAEGSITYTATATDSAGNTNTATETDTHDSVAPSVSVDTNPTGDDYVNASEDGSVTVTGTASDGTSGLDTVTVTTTGGGSVGPTSTDNANNWTTSSGIDVSGLQEGTITYTATATDNAGNANTASEADTHDSVAPSVDVGNNPTGDDYVNDAEDNSFTVSGTSSDTTSGVTSVTLEISDGGSSVSPSVSGTTSWNATGVNITSLADGSITYTATATDIAGNSNTASETDTHDSVAPSVTVDADPTGDDYVNAAEDDSVTVTGTASDATSGLDTVTVTTTGGGTVGPVSTDNANSWTSSSFDVSSLNEGSITYTATATDVAGNANSAAETDTHDSVAPSVSVDADPTGDDYINASEDGSVTVTGTASDGTSGLDTVTVTTTGGGTVGPTSTDNANSWTTSSGIDVSGLQEGTITYTATATDVAGNSNTATESDIHDSETPTYGNPEHTNATCHPADRCDTLPEDIQSGTWVKAVSGNLPVSTFDYPVFDNLSGIDSCTTTNTKNVTTATSGTDATVSYEMATGDGGKTATIECTDVAGNTSNDSAPSVTVDDSEPTIEAPEHTNTTCHPAANCDAPPEVVQAGVFVKADAQASPSVPKTTFKFDAADNTGGSGLPTDPCTLSGTQQDGSPYTPGNDFNVASGNGSKTFSVTCEDNLRNSSSNTSPSVTVDDSAPTMDAKHTNTTCHPAGRCDTVESVQADTYVKSVTDPVSGTPLSSFRYDVSDNSGGSGLPGTNPCTLDAGTQQNGPYNPGTDFNIDGPDGPDTFSITCDDNLGNQASSISPTLIVDDTAPTDVKTIPGSPTHPSGCDGFSGDCYLTSNTTLRVNVSDPTAGSEPGSGVDTCTVSATGQNFGDAFGFATPPCDAGDNDFTLPNTLSDDRYFIAVGMVDNIGNESVSPDPSQLDVILDNTPPTITTPIHTNDTCWPLDKCDAPPEAVLNNTWVKALDQAAFTPNNPLLPAYPSVPRSSFEFPEAGSSVDGTPIADPDIAPGLPGSGLLDCTLSGTQQDGVFTPGFGTIAFNIAVGDGASTFTLGCRDNLDNDNSLSRTVNVDDTPSTASFNTSGAIYTRPEDGVIFVESRTTIIPILSDAGVGVDLNGHTGSPSDGPQGSPECKQNIDQDTGRTQRCQTNFTFPPPDQDHAFWIMRPDKLGNVTEQRFPFVVDDTAPEITIDQPTEQAQYVLNEDVLAQWEVTDDISFFNDGDDSPFNPGLDKSGSGIRDLVATTPDGQPIDTDNVGAQAFNILAVDNLGHQNSVTVTYQVVYAFELTSAFAERLDDGPFEPGESIQIGFRLEDANGAFQNGAQPQVRLFTRPDEGEASEISLGVDPPVAQPTDEGDRYAYELSTAGLDPGTYQIRIEPGDGTTRTIDFTLEE